MNNGGHLLPKKFPDFDLISGVVATWGIELEMDGEEIDGNVHSTLPSDLEDNSSSKILLLESKPAK